MISLSVRSLELAFWFLFLISISRISVRSLELFAFWFLFSGVCVRFLFLIYYYISTWICVRSLEFAFLFFNIEIDTSTHIFLKGQIFGIQISNWITFGILLIFRRRFKKLINSNMDSKRLKIDALTETRKRHPVPKTFFINVPIHGCVRFWFRNNFRDGTFLLPVCNLLQAGHMYNWSYFATSWHTVHDTLRAYA
jgi:hypothetical protein